VQVCVIKLFQKKAGINCFYKELHVATAATATIIIRDANDVAGVWDRVLQLYHKIRRSAGPQIRILPDSSTAVTNKHGAKLNYFSHLASQTIKVTISAILAVNN